MSARRLDFHSQLSDQHQVTKYQIKFAMLVVLCCHNLEIASVELDQLNGAGSIMIKSDKVY